MNNKMKLLLAIIILVSCTPKQEPVKVVYYKPNYDSVNIHWQGRLDSLRNWFINNDNKDTLYINRYEMLSFYNGNLIAKYKGQDGAKLYEYYYKVYKFLDINVDGKIDTLDIKLLNQAFNNKQR